MENYDVAVIGAGVAGGFATYKLCVDNPNLKVAVIDIGRPPLKRRRQLEGWLGCLPNSDGKFFDSDIPKVESIIGKNLTSKSNEYLNSLFSSVFEFKKFKAKKVSKDLSKKIKGLGYSISEHGYFQIYPKDIHATSKKMNKYIEDHMNLHYYFDQEAFSIDKVNGKFVIKTDDAEINCDKVLLSVGRSGWRFAQQIYNHFGIMYDNSNANYGVKCEIGEGSCVGFNKSICELKKDNINIGKFMWKGTVIQEDHIDLSLSSFRSNEKRWESEKVSFDIIKNVKNENGLEESERLCKLGFLLANDRVLKEKANLFMEGKSKLSILKEFDWLKNSFSELNEVIEDFSSKANIYYPTMITTPGKIKIKENLETEVDGLFVAGECSGSYGLLYSALTGIAFTEQFGKV